MRLSFGAAHMTADRLTFAVLSSSYLVVAIPWEERSLKRVFGDEYERYQRQVRWRGIFRRIGSPQRREQASELLTSGYLGPGGFKRLTYKFHVDIVVVRAGHDLSLLPYCVKRPSFPRGWGIVFVDRPRGCE